MSIRPLPSHGRHPQPPNEAPMHQPCRHRPRILALISALVGIVACGDDALEDTDPIVTFGQETLDFSTGNEQYLAVVYNLPKGPAAPEAFVGFTLNAQGTGSALRVGPTRTRTALNFDARSAFNQTRYDAVKQWLSQRRASGALTTDLSTNATCTQTCDTNSFCWNNSCVTQANVAFRSPATQITANFVGVRSVPSLTVNVLIDVAQDTQPNRNAALSVVDNFLSTIADEFEILGLTSGHTGTLDRDSDGRLTVVFTNETQSTPVTDLAVLGFFDFFDALPATDPQATGNESDILWLRVPGTSIPPANLPITVELQSGTMAHEYVHFVGYAKRVLETGASGQQEALWLDEAMAQTMEDLLGWSPSNIDVVASALNPTGWELTGFGTSVDSGEQRGKSYLLLRHLIDQAAKAQGITSASDSRVLGVAAQIYGTLFSEASLGFEHSLFQNAGAAGLFQWYLALYAGIDGKVAVPEASAFDYLTVGTVTRNGTQRPIGYDPDADYINARGDQLLSGEGGDVVVPFEAFDTLSSPFESEISETGAALFLLSGFQGTVPLEARGDRTVDLRLGVQRVQ